MLNVSAGMVVHTSLLIYGEKCEDKKSCGTKERKD